MFKKLSLLAILVTGAVYADPRIGHWDQLDVEGGPGTVSIISGATADYSLTLPVDDGTSGQSLRTDGSGILSWVTPTAGTVTSVATGAGLTGGPITSSGTVAISNVSIALGGTGQTTATAAYDALSPNTTKGDITAHNGTTNIRVAVGTNGRVLTADSSAASGVAWAAPASFINPFAIVYMKDDFPANSEGDGLGELGWAEESVGTAATTVRKNGISGHPGIITIRPGTVAIGRAGIGLGGNGVNNEVLGDGETIITFLVRSAAVLTQLEEIAIGLGDTLNAVGDQTNGVYFRLLSGDTNWFLVTANAGTRTARDTGIAYSANTWIKLKFTINAGATSIQANINGSDAGAPIIDNIPTVAISPLAKVDGIAGGVASDTDVDVFEYQKTLTTPR